MPGSHEFLELNSYSTVPCLCTAWPALTPARLLVVCREAPDPGKSQARPIVRSGSSSHALQHLTITYEGITWRGFALNATPLRAPASSLPVAYLLDLVVPLFKLS
jgi:hypothetical protein